MFFPAFNSSFCFLHSYILKSANENPMKNRHHFTAMSIVSLLLYGLVATQAQPVITVPAQSRVESAGDHLAFSVGATGAAPLSYQWYFDTTNIPNATNLFVVVTNAQVTNSGTYTVVVSNSAGS